MQSEYLMETEEIIDNLHELANQRTNPNETKLFGKIIAILTGSEAFSIKEAIQEINKVANTKYNFEFKVLTNSIAALEKLLESKPKESKVD